MIGQENTIVGAYASVTGGRLNVASGESSHVSGGGGALPITHPSKEGNHASGLFSCISGGVAGVATGKWSSVSGGNNNDATGDGSSVCGGQNILATAPSSWAAGGLDREASLWWSAVVGGCLFSCP